jgi:hypothetical protein
MPKGQCVSCTNKKLLLSLMVLGFVSTKGMEKLTPKKAGLMELIEQNNINIVFPKNYSEWTD